VTFLVRDATRDDAGAIAHLCAEFAEYLGGLGEAPPRPVSAEELRRDGYGERPAFSGIVAEVDGGVAGYLLHHEGYDLVRGGRIWIVIDLFVTARVRRAGVGRALMERARAACRAAGCHALVWTVSPRNAQAIAFYDGLGATFGDDLLVTWPVD